MWPKRYLNEYQPRVLRTGKKNIFKNRLNNAIDVTQLARILVRLTVSLRLPG
jgi:hypothetical protein